MKSISHNEGAFTAEESHIDFFVLLLIRIYNYENAFIELIASLAC